MEWQSIETAPRVSGNQYSSLHWECAESVLAGGPVTSIPRLCTPVLLWGCPFIVQDQSMGAARCFVGFWSHMNERWEEQLQGMTDEAIEAYELIPTHWMPLPLPPPTAPR